MDEISFERKGKLVLIERADGALDKVDPKFGTVGEIEEEDDETITVTFAPEDDQTDESANAPATDKEGKPLPNPGH
jgi:hypothetical protein